MSNVFLGVLNLSISAGWIVLGVLLLRLLFRKAPKWITVCLWGIVGLRLLVPFAPESDFSLIPSAQTVGPEILLDPSPEIDSGIAILDEVVNPVIGASFAPQGFASANPLQIWIPVAAMLWLLGVAACLIYTAVSYWLIRRKVRTAVLLRDRIWQSEAVETPFVLGIIRPKIYLPFTLGEPELTSVIAHEEAHIRRRDHWWKPLGFLLLSLHWFNPLLWLGYGLLCRDIELAYDERAVKGLDRSQRADYSQALLRCSISRRSLIACPLAFGEVSVKQRVKAVLGYKKPAFWLILLAALVSLIAAFCFLTNPRQSVRDVLKPNTAWHCSDPDIRLSVDENAVMEGYFQRGNVYHGISVAFRYSGKTAVAEIYERSLDGAQTSPVQPIIRGKFVAKNSKLILEIEEDRWGLGVEEVVFRESEDSDAATRVHAVLSPAGEPLTLDDVIALSQKGDALQLGDFADFDHLIGGSGLYIRIYPIDELFSLSIGSNGCEGEVLYYSLQAEDASRASIDIRSGDVEGFINAHKGNPVVERLGYTLHACPVDYTGAHFTAMAELGGISGGDRAPVVLKIDTLSQLQEFTEKMDSSINFDLSYPDAPAFQAISGEYSELFFDRNSLILVYLASGTSADRFHLATITKSQGTLCLQIQEKKAAAGDTVMQGWLLCISVSKSSLEDVIAMQAQLVTADR